MKGRMEQTFKTTTATAAENGVEEITTGNIKRIDYSEDDTGKHYTEKNEPIEAKRAVLGPEAKKLMIDKRPEEEESGVLEETKERMKQVRRRRPDGSQEELLQMEESTMERTRTPMKDQQTEETEETLTETTITQETPQAKAPKKVPVAKKNKAKGEQNTAYLIKAFIGRLKIFSCENYCASVAVKTYGCK